MLLIACASMIVGGCAQRGAPSFSFFGAFFPDWTLLAGVGIVAAIGARVALVATGLVEVVPVQLVVCASAGLIIAILVWLLWFAT